MNPDRAPRKQPESGKIKLPPELIQTTQHLWSLSEQLTVSRREDYRAKLEFEIAERLTSAVSTILTLSLDTNVETYKEFVGHFYRYLNEFIELLDESKSESVLSKVSAIFQLNGINSEDDNPPRINLHLRFLVQDVLTELFNAFSLSIRPLVTGFKSIDDETEFQESHVENSTVFPSRFTIDVAYGQSLQTVSAGNGERSVEIFMITFPDQLHNGVILLPGIVAVSEELINGMTRFEVLNVFLNSLIPLAYSYDPHYAVDHRTAQILSNKYSQSLKNTVTNFEDFKNMVSSFHHYLVKVLQNLYDPYSEEIFDKESLKELLQKEGFFNTCCLVNGLVELFDGITEYWSSSVFSAYGDLVDLVCILAERFRLVFEAVLGENSPKTEIVELNQQLRSYFNKKDEEMM